MSSKVVAKHYVQSPLFAQRDTVSDESRSVRGSRYVCVRNERKSATAAAVVASAALVDTWRW